MWRTVARWTLMLAVSGVCATRAMEFTHPDPRTNQPIVVVSDPGATLKLQPQPDRVRAMVERGLLALTGASEAAAAWRTVAGSNDVVAIKVFSSPGPITGTRIPVVEAVVDGLLQAGVLRTNIFVWDRSETDLRNAGFGRLETSHGISVRGALQAGYEESDFYEFALVTGLRYGDLEFGKQTEGAGRRSFVTKLLGPRVTRIISISPAANKHSTGVTGHLYSLTMGAVDNTWRFESNPSTFSWALPEIFAMRSVGDRAVLYITDALICQYEGEEATLLHYSKVANELFLGKDPVAMDLLAIRLLKQERRASDSMEIKPNLDTYRNAALLQLGVDNLDQVPIKRISLDSTAAKPAQPPPAQAAKVRP